MRSAAAICLLASMILAPPAHGQGVEQARVHFQRAVEAVDRGAVGEAIVEFERSYEASPRPRTLYNIALLLETAGRLDEALEAADQIRPTSLQPDEQQRLLQLRRHEAAMARVDLTVEPPQATVTIDGVVRRWPSGRSRILWVQPGAHRIAANMNGRHPWELSRTFQAGERLSETASLGTLTSPVATPAPSPVTAPAVRPAPSPTIAGTRPAPTAPTMPERPSAPIADTDLPIARIVVARTLVADAVRRASFTTVTGTGVSLHQYVLTSAELVNDALAVGVAYRGEGQLRPAQVAWKNRSVGLALLWVPTPDAKSLEETQLRHETQPTDRVEVLTYQQGVEPVAFEVALEGSTPQGGPIIARPDQPVTLGALVTTTEGEILGLVGPSPGGPRASLRVTPTRGLGDIAALDFSPTSGIAMTPMGRVPAAVEAIEPLRIAAAWNALQDQIQSRALTAVQRKGLGVTAERLGERVSGLSDPLWSRQPFYQRLPELARSTADYLCNGQCTEAPPQCQAGEETNSCGDGMQCIRGTCHVVRDDSRFFVGLVPHLGMRTVQEDAHHFEISLEAGYNGLSADLGALAFALRIAAQLRVGSYRAEPVFGIDIELGGEALLGRRTPLVLELSYLPGFILAEGRSHWSWRGYRLAAGLRFGSWTALLSWIERGRDADDTLRLMGLHVRLGF